MLNSRFTEFEGAVAIVSGAAQGIGLAVANTLYELGATVVALDTQFSADFSAGFGSEEAYREVGGQKYFRLHLDVANLAAVERCFEGIESEIGPVTYIAHCAGILRLGSVLTQEDEDWRNTFNVNLFGALNVCRSGARLMAPRKTGSITVVGSNASSTPRMGMGAYAASKAAATIMVQCLALEVAKDNIRCNIVAPGSTDTPMQRQMWQRESDSEKVIQGETRKFRLGIPLGRIASVEQVSNTVLFLLSNMASHITMETVKVDGGATLG